LAWGYNDGLGNLEVDVVGATDSLTGDVMLMVILIVVVVIVVVVVLLTAWIGGIGAPRTFHTWPICDLLRDCM